MNTSFRARGEFPTGSDLLWCIGEMRARSVRSMSVFAEAEIVIPDGPFKDMRFSCARQPYSKLFFDAVDSGLYRDFIAVGPTQSGKTLTCFVIPLLYHLFEVRETVICVVPDLNMVDDKWTQDIRPAIEASRYKSLLPVRGEGSRGGKVTNAITFLNGTTLKFMTAGGGDTNRAAFTARVVLITELNKFGVKKASSAESDMFRQVKGRMRSFGDRARLYGECTVTNEHGLVWTEYLAGTGSRVAFPCGHCGEYVSPGREQLVGWDEAKNVMEAEKKARWCCPSCGVIWDEGDRRAFVKGSVLVHRGQEIVNSEFRIVNGEKEVGTTESTENTERRPPLPPRKRGDKITAETAVPHSSGGSFQGLVIGQLLPGYEVVGEAPETWSLGFRWSAIDNLFLKTGYLGSGEWAARNLAENEHNAEVEQLQFVWALPVPDDSDKSITLRPDQLCHRQGRFGRGIIPPGAGLVAFLDLGKYKCFWGVVAGLPMPGGKMRYWLVDAGIIRTEMDHLVEREAMLVAMREFHGICEKGYLQAGSDGLEGRTAGESQTGMSEPLWSPALRFVDSGKWAPEVYDFIQEMAAQGHDGYFPSKGFGVSQDQERMYTEPNAVTDRVLVVGDRYHVSALEAREIALVHMGVDTWKSRVHAALRAPVGEDGSLVFWKDDWKVHMAVARHLLNEVSVEEFDQKKGQTVTKWIKKSRDNHWLDVTTGCFVALDYLAVLSHGEGIENSEFGIVNEEGPSGREDGRLLGEVRFGGALVRN